MRIIKTLLLAGCNLIIIGHLYAQNPKQKTFPLSEVELTDSIFLKARAVDLHYMLKLSPDRLLAPYLREAGLSAKAISYGNWENSGLDGHTAGHYLTALSQMYASTGNPQCLERLKYMLKELKKCQDANGNGYIGGIPGGKEMWLNLGKGDFKLYKSKWVPWYNLHKLFAGLNDTYQITHLSLSKKILIKYCDWAANAIADLSEKQLQEMLSIEYGGMNEVFADVAEITGNRKYLEIAKKFNHQAILVPLEQEKDNLNGLHANTQIPKILGFKKIAELTGDKKMETAAAFFWKTVVDNRSISIGGNSVREHFNPSNNFMSMIRSEEGPETCNSYNMLKLSKNLFLTNPDRMYMDYYEKTIYNHILSSQSPDLNGGFIYFTPIRPQHYRVYSEADEDFWCCVGTGMENHGKYNEMIYTQDQNNLFVNLFIGSKLNWKEQKVKIIQKTNFPFEEKSNLAVSLAKPKKFAINIRKPNWANAGGFQILINGESIPTTGAENGYIKITRIWHNGDEISISLPMSNHLEYLPDGSPYASILHGPIVLAAATDRSDMKGEYGDGSRAGHIAKGKLIPLSASPVLLNKGFNTLEAMQPIAGKSLSYKMPNIIYPNNFKSLVLKPFFQVQHTRYMLYWPVINAADSSKIQSRLTESDQDYTLRQITVDQVSPGEQQPESDHFMESVDSESGILENRHYRVAKKSFSYVLKSQADAKYIEITCNERDNKTKFDILVNELKVATIDLTTMTGTRYITKRYPIPLQFAKLDKLKISFKAIDKFNAGPVYDVRIIK